MSRMKSIFAVLMLGAMAVIVPQAQAQTLKVVIAGSSALWQTLALGAYGNGNCAPALSGCTSPTFHWTSAKSGATEPYLNDARPSTANQDAGPIWVVWDSTTPAPNVWVFAKVDSVVGDRCYFAQPHCSLVLPSGASNVGGALISSGLWGADTNLPANIQSILTSGSPVTVAATDIRPEDAAWAAARVNSKLGASTYGGGSSDGLDGLGYNVNNASGVPATHPAGAGGVGTPILSGLPGSTQQANVLAFNITGKDPFSNTTIPGYTVTPVGGAPIVFVNSRSPALANLKNATEAQLQELFSGEVCDASVFGSGFSGGVNVFLREPLSGTYNTVEATVFRRPTVYPGTILGVSQEKNVGVISANSNPLTAATTGECVSNPSGTGARYRGIGTGEVITEVQFSNNTSSCSSSSPCFTTAQDGIAYAFFSYGNVKPLADSASYGYITLNGVDPIFQTYGSNLDPGQPAGGQLPGTADLPAACGTAGTFPCAENVIWKNGFSFPNLRNGTYRAWSLLRLVSNGTASTNAAQLVKASNSFVVTSTPDYVPYGAITASGVADLGLKVLRSHYEQKDGNGNQLGAAGAATNVPEKGGDMGGFIIPTTIGVTTEKQTQLVQHTNSDNSNLGPVARP